MGPTLEPTSYVWCKVDRMKWKQKMASPINDFSSHVNAKMCTSIQSWSFQSTINLKRTSKLGNKFKKLKPSTQL